VGLIAALVLCVLFAHTYQRNPLTTSAHHLAIIFGGVASNYLTNILSLVVNMGNACFGLPYYYIRITGLGAMCLCIVYGGMKLLVLGATPARVVGEETSGDKPPVFWEQTMVRTSREAIRSELKPEFLKEQS
jgi:hypothetical protein